MSRNNVPLTGPSLTTLFGQLPDQLRASLTKAFDEVITNYRKRKWEPSELNCGKLCEVVYTILRGYVDGVYPDVATKPANMLDACRALERETAVSRAVRIQIPRMLIALYEVRNNRGVGHVSGDIDPNHMDSMVVVHMSKWIIAELIRVLHGVDTEEAQAAVEILSEREVPIIWDVGGVKRVLNTKLTMKEKSLLLLYSSTGAVGEMILFQWVEHSKLSSYRRDVLRPAHKEKLIEYDEVAKLVTISPAGEEFVEDRVISKI